MSEPIEVSSSSLRALKKSVLAKGSFDKKDLENLFKVLENMQTQQSYFEYEVYDDAKIQHIKPFHQLAPYPENGYNETTKTK